MRRFGIMVIVAGLLVPGLVTGGAVGAEGGDAPTSGSVDGQVRDGYAQAVLDATVTLWPTSGDPIEMTATANGNFTFDEVPFGSYRLVAEAEGYGERWWPLARSSGAADLIEISADDPALELDLVYGVGRVTGTVTETVDEMTTAVVGAEVTLIPDLEADWAVRPTVTTDQSGQFTFRGIDDGGYRLGVQTGDERPGFFYGSVDDIWAATVLTIDSVEGTIDYSGLELVVPGEPEEQSPPPTGSISGTVTEPALVTVRGVDNGIQRELFVSEAGPWSIGELPDGDYEVSFTTNLTSEVYPDIVTVTNGIASASPEFTIAPPIGELIGKVTANDVPVQGISVIAQLDGDEWDEGISASAQTDENGEFRITSIPAGDWRLRTQIADGGNWWFGNDGSFTNATIVNVQIIDDLSIMTLDGQPTALLALELPGGSISGTITLPDGVASSDIFVYVSGVDSNVWRSVWLEEPGTWTIGTLPDGTYRVSAEVGGLGDLQYPDHVTVVDGMASIASVDITAPAGVITGRVTLGPDPLPYAAVTAEPFDPESCCDYRYGQTDGDGSFSLGGLTAGDWRLRINLPDGGQWYYGGTDGRYSTAIPVTVEITDLGAGPVSSMYVNGEPVLLLEIDLPDGSISGTIASSDGLPLDDVNIRVTNLDTGLTRTTYLWEPAPWTITALPDGPYQVSAELWNIGTTVYPDTVYVVSGVASTTVDFDIAAPIGVISGVVTRNGQPVENPGVRAELIDDNEYISRSATSEQNGDFRIDGLNNGTWRVGVNFDSGTWWYGSDSGSEWDATVITVDVIDGDDGPESVMLVGGEPITSIGIDLPGGVISGTVTLPEGVAADDIGIYVSGDENNVWRSVWLEEPGPWSVDTLPDGDYRISAQIGEFGSITHPEMITVVSGVASNTVDITVPSGSISGTLSAPDGIDITWAQITVIGQDNSVWRHTYIDGPGAWSIGFLPDGTYRVEASIDGVGELRHPDLVVVSGGDDTGPVELTVPAGRIDGNVTRSEDPAAGLQVFAIPVVNDDYDPQTWTTTTLTDGGFSLLGLPAGDYHIYVQTGSYTWVYGSTGSTIRAEIVTVEIDHDGDMPVSRMIVAGAPIDRIDIELPDLTITGTLSYRGDTLADRPITLEGSAWESTTTDENGRFTFDGLRPGDYVLTLNDDPQFRWVTFPVSSGWEQPTLTLGDDVPSLDIAFEIPQGALVGSALRDGEPMVALTNHDPDDLDWYSSVEPTVIATRYVANGYPGTTMSAPLGTDGSFRLDGLAPGEYLIQILDEYGNLTHIGIDDVSSVESYVIGPDSLDVAVQPIDLPGNGTLSGTVATTSGGPIADAYVYARTDRRSLTTRTNALGMYSFPAIAPGTYQIEAHLTNGEIWQAPGVRRPDQAVPVNVAPGAVVDGIDVTVADRIDLTGVVTDPDDQPLENITVVANLDWFEDEWFSSPVGAVWGQTDENGRYELTGLPVGVPVLLSFIDFTGRSLPQVYPGPAASLETADRLVLDGIDPEPTYDMQMGPAGSISGVIRNAAGARTGAEVRLIPVAVGDTPDDRFGYSSVITADGSYRFTGLPAGRYTVSAITADGTSGVGWLGGAPGAATATVIDLGFGDVLADQTVVIPAGGTVTGTITANGVGVAGIEVGVGPGGGPWTWRLRTAVTRADGTYSITGLPEVDQMVVMVMPPRGSSLAYTESGRFDLAANDTLALDPIDLVPGVQGAVTLYGRNGELLTPASAQIGIISGTAVSTCPAPGVYEPSIGGCSEGVGFIPARAHPDGIRWLVGPLAPGTYNMRSDAVLTSFGQVAGTNVEFTVGTGETFDCELSLIGGPVADTCDVVTAPAASNLSGTVLGSDGLGVPGITVTLHGHDEWSTYYSTVSDLHGNYTFSDIAGGDYVVGVSTPPNRPVYARSFWTTSGSVSEFSAAERTTLGDAETVADFDLTVYGASYGTATVRSGGIQVNPMETDISAAVCPGTITAAEWTNMWGCPSGGAQGISSTPNGFALGPFAPGTYSIRASSWSVGSASTPIATFTVTEGDIVTCGLTIDVGGKSACVVTNIDFERPVDTAPAPPSTGTTATSALIVDTTVTTDPENPEAEPVVTTSLIEVTLPPDGGTTESTSTTLSNVAVKPAPPEPFFDPTDEGAVAQTSVIGFDVLDTPTDENGDPLELEVVVWLPSPANAYIKYSRATEDALDATWWDATSLVTFDAQPTIVNGVERWKAVIKLTDGALGDADWTVNGVISDPGVFALRPTTEPPPPPPPPPPPAVECISGQIVLWNDAAASIDVTIDGDVVDVSVDAGTLGSRSVDIVEDDVVLGTCAYDVTVDFLGFERPISDGELNRANAGRSIPVKFRIVDANGVGVGNPDAIKAITNTVATCASVAEDAEFAPDTVGSGLTHLGDGNWQFNWKTNRGWSGSCRNLRISLTGAPALHAVTFDFR